MYYQIFETNRILSQGELNIWISCETTTSIRLCYMPGYYDVGLVMYTKPTSWLFEPIIPLDECDGMTKPFTLRITSIYELRF